MRLSGQRIVARLRERIFSRALQQEVAFMEKGEGDVISRLSVDTSIVGESYVQISSNHNVRLVTVILVVVSRRT